MSGPGRELRRLRATRAVLARDFPRFGVNKTRELTRLVCEISRREGVPPERVLSGTAGLRYPRLRKVLLRRRYPAAAATGVLPEPLLLPLDLPPADVAAAPGAFPAPRRIVWEARVAASPLLARFRAAFPEADGIEVPSLRQWLREGAKHRFSPADYNRRRETILVGAASPRPFQPCPCSPSTHGCGYHIYDLAAGCSYDCSYCFLQEYANTPGLFFPAWARPAAGLLERYRGNRRLRIGTGEFADSLALDSLTGYSRELVEFFRGREGVVFEFKTKSDEVGGLLDLDPGDNIVIGFSLSPPGAAAVFDHGAPPPPRRLAAAEDCRDAGYRVAFHLDPVVFLPGWEEGYRQLIRELRDRFLPEQVAWLSLGTVRFRPRMLQVLERRFPGDPILDQELFPGYDGKLRYLPGVRVATYRRLLDFFGPERSRWPLYLCMEDADTWRALGLPDPFRA